MITLPLICYLKPLVFLLLVSTMLLDKDKVSAEEMHSYQDFYGSKEVILQTSLGTLRGLRESSLPLGPSSEVKPYFAFRKIPYIHPAVGEDRWQDPEPAGAWSGELDARWHGPGCPQYDISNDKVQGEEDCLFLNVYTPFLPKDVDNKTRLPVLFFIHGGAKVRGSSVLYGPEKIMNYDIVLVTLDYRLGALGFLSTGDEEMAGNYGILDVIMGLQWVNDHIQEFGGDASQITAGGFSAGSADVSMLPYMHRAKGLFHRAIMMSGAVTCEWAVHHQPDQVARSLASHLNCPESPSRELRRCLSSKSFEEIVRGQAKQMTYGIWPLPFRLVVDAKLRPNPVLPVDIQELLSHPPVTPVPLLAGFTSEDALVFVATLILYSKNPLDTEATHDEVVRTAVEPMYTNNTVASVITDLLNQFYHTPEGRTDLEVLMEEMTVKMSDIYFLSCETDYLLRFAQSSLHPVYSYLFTYREATSAIWGETIFAKLRERGIDNHLLRTGVSHGDDVVHLFAYANTQESFTDMDLRMSSLMTARFANFITTGSPTAGDGEEEKVVWTPLEPGKSFSYLNLTLDPFMVQRYSRERELRFCSEFVPSMAKKLQASSNDVIAEEPSTVGWRDVLPYLPAAALLLLLLQLGSFLRIKHKSN